jgi:hypothetical protein
VKRIGVLFQLKCVDCSFFYFRKDWCSNAEMAYHCGDRGLDGCCSDEDQVHRASLVWTNDKYVDRYG